MTTAVVIYIVVCSVLACSFSVYVSIHLYLDLERMKEAEHIRKNNLRKHPAYKISDY